jgi:hypothetical protein
MFRPMVEQTGNVRYAVYELRVYHLFVRRARVWVQCAACRHEGEVDPFKLVKVCGSGEQLRFVEARFRCTSCRAKGYCSLKIEWDDPRRSVE